VEVVKKAEEIEHLNDVRVSLSPLFTMLTVHETELFSGNISTLFQSARIVRTALTSSMMEVSSLKRYLYFFDADGPLSTQVGE
jgi:hypothetical protein